MLRFHRVGIMARASRGVPTGSRKFLGDRRRGPPWSRGTRATPYLRTPGASGEISGFRRDSPGHREHHDYGSLRNRGLAWGRTLSPREGGESAAHSSRASEQCWRIGDQEGVTMAKVLSDKELDLMDAYWRAA